MKKLVAGIITVGVIVNLVIFALGLTNGIFFWSVIVLAAIFTYYVLPRIKEK